MPLLFALYNQVDLYTLGEVFIFLCPIAYTSPVIAMIEGRKTGRTTLRGVDGARATGICHYASGPKGSEYTISAQLPGAVTAEVVLQYGPSRGYQCRPPEPLSNSVKCPDGSVAALWVMSGGKPLLFGILGTGPFDQAEARRKLLSYSKQSITAKPQRVRTSAIQLPAAAQPEVAPRPSFREPSSKSEPPFPLPEQKPGAAAAVEIAGANTATAVLQKESPARSLPAQAQRGTEIASAAQPNTATNRKPLVLKRAPRPTPHPPVYSPLWDDVSFEFEKMLQDLPAARPFNGSAHDAEIVELPTDGAVQCYVGSVLVDGMKVFLQAVPARPFGRPAGFDHSLVSRDGECYWVKYFIQSE